MASDDDWGEESELKPPTVLFEARVVRDHIPTNNEELTLILDDMVYVYKTEVPGKAGYWEGETNGVIGIFPSVNVKRAQKIDVVAAKQDLIQSVKK